MSQAADPTWERLEDQIEWYDTRSGRNQLSFKRLKYVEIVAAAAIPVVSAFGETRVAAAVLGGLVLLIEAILHLNQYQQNWITYRATAEALKHEKFLYLAQAGPYAAATDPRVMLAERVEGLASQEHAKWVSAREEAASETAATSVR
jgi:Protein of unknown function (DUF4231)